MKNFSLSKDIYSIIKSINLEANSFNNKNIVISGAFGFIGKYILECLHLIKKEMKLNFNIYAIDNFITSDETIKSFFEKKGINCINHDINKKLNIDVEFDFIICLAGIASPYYYNKYPVETLNASINGLNNMFELKHNTNSKFIFFSSSEIYGDPPSDQIPTNETYRGNVTSIGPRSCYDESKRVGETICYINSNFFHKKTTIIRPFNVFGPGMALNDYRIIPNITRSFILNEKFQIYGTGNQTRTYCYISDAISGFFKAILKDEFFGVYNIGNDDDEMSVINLLKNTEDVMKVKLNYIKTSYPNEYPPDEPRRRCPDISKAKKNLNFYPKISLKEGLYNHFSWARKYFKN